MDLFCDSGNKLESAGTSFLTVKQQLEIFSTFLLSICNLIYYETTGI